MAAIWTVRDREDREVSLTEARVRHILARRPRTASRLVEIGPTIEAPDVVTRDAEYPHRENHYRRPSPDRSYLKVVVQYRPAPPQGTWTGEVITAHPTERIIPEETQLWP